MNETKINNVENFYDYRGNREVSRRELLEELSAIRAAVGCTGQGREEFDYVQKSLVNGPKGIDRDRFLKNVGALKEVFSTSGQLIEVLEKIKTFFEL